MTVAVTHRATRLSTPPLACGRPEECRGCSGTITKAETCQGEADVGKKKKLLHSALSLSREGGKFTISLQYAFVKTIAQLTLNG